MSHVAVKLKLEYHSIMSDDDDDPPGFPLLMAIPAINWILHGAACLAVGMVSLGGGLHCGLFLPLFPCGVAVVQCGVGIFAGRASFIGPVTILTAFASIASFIEALNLIGRGSWEAGLFFASETVTVAVSALIAVELIPRWNDWVEASRAS